MAMSKKQYKAVAAMIAEVVEATPVHSDRMQATRSIARGLASMFAEDNPEFDRNKFLDACGL